MKALSNKVCSFLKRKPTLITGLLIFVALSIFLTPRYLSSKFGIFIQAASIIVLAVITYDYALQTRRLADEQRTILNEYIAKRNIEHLERGIAQFYIPIGNCLSKLSVALETENMKIITERYLDFSKTYLDMRTLATFKAAQKVHYFVIELKDLIIEDKLAEALNLFRIKGEELQSFLNEECLALEFEIRNFYGR